MEKLTLEQIAPYLPYEMYVQSQIPATFEEVYKVIGIKNEALRCEGSSYDSDIDDFKVVLRPMDLTKPIIVKGKKVIPIMELAKIAYPMEDFELSENQSMAISSRFNFEYFLGSFLCYNYQTDCTISVKNQLSLFQWLFKHKFDVFGLIAKKLAVDLNTLETNPYN